MELKTNLNQGGLIALKREPFYTKDLHFAAYLLLEGYQPEIKVPFQGAKKVMFLYPETDFSTLRDLRTRFEGDKNLTVNLFDYVRAMRELGDRISYIKRETLKKEAGQNDRNEATGQQPTI